MVRLDILTILRQFAPSPAKRLLLGSFSAKAFKVYCRQSISISVKSMRRTWQFAGQCYLGYSLRQECAMGARMDIAWVAKISLLKLLRSRERLICSEIGFFASPLSRSADQALNRLDRLLLYYFMPQLNQLIIITPFKPQQVNQAPPKGNVISDILYFPIIFIHPLQMANNYDFMFKFIIIGDSSVGKSCLLLRFTEGRFKTDHEPTLGVEFGSKNIAINNFTIKIQIWDTAGQESFKSITRSYYKSSIAAFLVFDLTKRDTFENLNKWLFQVKNNSHDKIQTVVLGNKSDIKQSRQVTTEEAQKFASTHGFAYYETSAQNGYNVEDVFKNVAEKVVKMIDSKQINAESQASYGIKRGKKQKSNNVSPNKNSNTENNGNITIQRPIQTEKKKCCGN